MYTPIELENLEFKSAPLGYNKNEVDDFVETISEDYEKLYKENIALKDKNNLLADAKAAGMRKVVLPKGIYRVSNKTTINIPSGMTLDLNGATIKLNQFAGSGALIIRMVPRRFSVPRSISRISQ